MNRRQGSRDRSGLSYDDQLDWPPPDAQPPRALELAEAADEAAARIHGGARRHPGTSIQPGVRYGSFSAACSSDAAAATS